MKACEHEEDLGPSAKGISKIAESEVKRLCRSYYIVSRFNILIYLILIIVGCGGGDHGESGSPPPTEPPPTIIDPTGPMGPFAPYNYLYNSLEPRPWWRDSEPYSCHQRENSDSPWLQAGLIDLGGSDALSLIRYFGNGSYLRYGSMGFHGCTPLNKYPNRFNLDQPADPTYYSLGDLDIYVDIARVPASASGWFQDDGIRVNFSMEKAVELLNQHIAAYFRRISENNLRITFHAGNEFTVGGNGSPAAMEDQQISELGICVDVQDCERYGSPGALNRILLNDVSGDTGGQAWNGWGRFGLVSFRDAAMALMVHEMGHGWMGWPHSFAELPWQPDKSSAEVEGPNPYTNFYDIMSRLDLFRITGWDSNMPSTLAINRYSAGWIRPENVALHLEDRATYTLSKPREGGYQFLVIHSGRRYAFTTLEVLEERSFRYKVKRADVYDPSAPGGKRRLRYEGVLVSRYDQTSGTGINARLGPALYNKNNPDFLTDVGWGRDDYSVIADGETRDIGGGVSVEVARNQDGSYEVTVSGGKIAEFQRWCSEIWLSSAENLEDRYDTGCLLSEPLRR